MHFIGFNAWYGWKFGGSPQVFFNLIVIPTHEISFSMAPQPVMLPCNFASVQLLYYFCLFLVCQGHIQYWPDWCSRELPEDLKQNYALLFFLNKPSRFCGFCVVDWSRQVVSVVFSNQWAGPYAGCMVLLQHGDCVMSFAFGVRSLHIISACPLVPVGQLPLDANFPHILWSCQPGQQLNLWLIHWETLHLKRPSLGNGSWGWWSMVECVLECEWWICTSKHKPNATFPFSTLLNWKCFCLLVLISMFFHENPQQPKRVEMQAVTSTEWVFHRRWPAGSCSTECFGYTSDQLTPDISLS